VIRAAREGEQSDVEWKFVYRRPFLAIRSIAGVGTTPPNVPGAPNPLSSVMMSSTLGAPFGGTTRGGHHGFDSEAFSLITPPNFGSGGGICLPSSVVVAIGEPRGAACCARVRSGAPRKRTSRTKRISLTCMPSLPDFILHMAEPYIVVALP
jgi:hypothetical protein